VTGSRYDEVWRSELPHVVAALTRRYGHFDDCEDAAQRALIAASEQWPRDGLPGDPRAWLLRVASRRLVDQLRQDESRRSREDREARLAGVGSLTEGVVPDAAPETDDTLQLMLLCCHPALSPASQVALTLRAVAGLTTREIAMGFLVPEATMAQRISRAKSTLARAGARFSPPGASDLPGRTHAVRHAISLIFTQGHLRSEGPVATDSDLRSTAVTLARKLAAALPRDPENHGLLALLLLTEARTSSRVDADGDLVPLEHQDRSLWNHALIDEGTRLLQQTLPRGYVGAFQVQAAIAAVHAEAADFEHTDWPQILALYRMLDRIAPSTATTVGLATATAEVDGPQAGLRVLEGIAEDRNHRVHAVRGHLLARIGDNAGAEHELTTAARLTRSVSEQRYLNRMVTALHGGPEQR
jgi:RNA polymerase sigma factor (sigma-70 family)